MATNWQQIGTLLARNTVMHNWLHISCSITFLTIFEKGKKYTLKFKNIVSVVED